MCWLRKDEDSSLLFGFIYFWRLNRTASHNLSVICAQDLFFLSKTTAHHTNNFNVPQFLSVLFELRNICKEDHKKKFKPGSGTSSYQLQEPLSTSRKKRMWNIGQLLSAFNNKAILLFCTEWKRGFLNYFEILILSRGMLYFMKLNVYESVLKCRPSIMLSETAPL